MAETKLKELCKQLGVPAPRYEPPPMVHPIDEGLLGEKAAPMTSKELEEGPAKEDEPGISGTTQKIMPTLVTKEIKQEQDVKPMLPLRLGLLSDTMLDAVGAYGDKDCRITRIKRGRDPFYDLTKDDEELKEAFCKCRGRRST